VLQVLLLQVVSIGEGSRTPHRAGYQTREDQIRHGRAQSTWCRQEKERYARVRRLQYPIHWCPGEGGAQKGQEAQRTGPG